jgi:hypothetical protein
VILDQNEGPIAVVTDLKMRLGVIDSLIVVQHDCLSTFVRWRGNSGPAKQEGSTRCDDFVEQRKHSSMTPHVIDVNERGSTIMWTEGVVSKLAGRIKAMSELVSRRNYCA